MPKCDFVKFGSPDMVQVPGRPLRRWRCPPDHVKVEACYHLKVVCHLIRQSLPHHHHCPQPGQEIGQRGKGNDVSSSQTYIQQLGLDSLKHGRKDHSDVYLQISPDITPNKQGFWSSDLDARAEVSRVVSIVVVIVPDPLTDLSRQPPLGLLTQLQIKNNGQNAFLSITQDHIKQSDSCQPLVSCSQVDHCRGLTEQEGLRLSWDSVSGGN